MKSIVLFICSCLIPMFGIAQCGNINIEVENNSLIINHDSLGLDCEAVLDFSGKKVGDTIKIYEINQNRLHDCPPIGSYLNPLHNIMLEVAGFNSGSFILQLLYQFASNVDDTITCGQIDFTVEPGYTSDSICIENFSINEITSNDVNINKPNTFRISQNFPNPFSHETRINLYIPQKVNNSKIYFFDITGRQKYMKEINERGSFDFNISNNFPSGIYYYFIMIDNEKSKTKKMIVAK